MCYGPHVTVNEIYPSSKKRLPGLSQVSLPLQGHIGSSKAHPVCAGKAPSSSLLRASSRGPSSGDPRGHLGLVCGQLNLAAWLARTHVQGHSPHPWWRNLLLALDQARPVYPVSVLDDFVHVNQLIPASCRLAHQARTCGFSHGVAHWIERVSRQVSSQVPQLLAPQGPGHTYAGGPPGHSHSHLFFGPLCRTPAGSASDLTAAATASPCVALLGWQMTASCSLWILELEPGKWVSIDPSRAIFMSFV